MDALFNSRTPEPNGANGQGTLTGTQLCLRPRNPQHQDADQGPEGAYTDSSGTLVNSSSCGSIPDRCPSPAFSDVDIPAMRPNRDFVKDEATGEFLCPYRQQGNCDIDAKKKCTTKSQWNTHMDKHEYPYKCWHRECANHEGFQYVAGLKRHCGSVHHEGPDYVKGGIHCIWPDCEKCLLVDPKAESFSRLDNCYSHVLLVHADEDHRKYPRYVKRAIRNMVFNQRILTSERLDRLFEEAEQNPEPQENARGKKRKAKNDLEGEKLKRQESVIEALQKQIREMDQALHEKDQEIAGLKSKNGQSQGQSLVQAEANNARQTGGDAGASN